MFGNTPRVLLALVAAAAVGCGKVQDAQNRARGTNDLKELGLAYILFQDKEQRPPKSYEELTRQFPLPPECARATVVWGAGAAGMCKDGPSSDVILGHLRNPGGKGVLALYCDGSVRAITDEEFNVATKAKPLPDRK